MNEEIENLAILYNVYRDFGWALNLLQPGLTRPVPDGDPNEVDAMKVMYRADQLLRERRDGK